MATHAQVRNNLIAARQSLYDQVLAAKASNDLSRVGVLAKKIKALNLAIDGPNPVAFPVSALDGLGTLSAGELVCTVYDAPPYLSLSFNLPVSGTLFMEYLESSAGRDAQVTLGYTPAGVLYSETTVLNQTVINNFGAPYTGACSFISGRLVANSVTYLLRATIRDTTVTTTLERA